jgi:hypothetical protein
VANFLTFEPVPDDVSAARGGESVNAGESSISEWDGNDIWFIHGTAYPVTHVLVKGGDGRRTIVALDLGLDSPDDMMTCKILLDAARTFSGIALDDDIPVLAIDGRKATLNDGDRTGTAARRASSIA